MFLKLAAFSFRIILSLRYHLEIKGQNILKLKNPKLFLPNHQSLIDPILIVATVLKRQKISSAVAAKYFDSIIFRTILNWIDAFPISDLETGRRDTSVLNTLINGIVSSLSKGNNALIYASGQLSSQEKETIGNKQGVFKTIPHLPENVLVIGVRVSGLWGSSWSKAKTGKTPNFMKAFWAGVVFLLKHFIFFAPKRNVQLELVDLTNVVKEYANTDRKTFNTFLESFFNNKVP